MFHFVFLKKYRTFAPTYKYDFVRFTYYGFVFSFALESIFILGGKYEKLQKENITKELNNLKSYDNSIEDRKRKNLLKQQKIEELKLLEAKLK